MSMRHAILGVLRQGAVHGYQIGVELGHFLPGGRYNSAQIYQGLRWLEERRFVIAEPPRPGVFRDRRPFTITAAGRREFERWLREPIAAARQVRDDGLIKVAFLCRENPEILVHFLERLHRQHLRRLAAEMQASSRCPEAQAPGESFLEELSSAVLRFREEAELRWIEYCLLRLRSGSGPEAVDVLGVPSPAPPPAEVTVARKNVG